SADGIDVALARISGAPPNLNAKLLGQTSFTFPRPLRKEILRVAEQQPIGAGDLSRLNFRLGRIFAEAALAACGRLGVPPQRVSLNLGGIANITVIPANAKPSQVFAFDTGPANMLIDALVQHFTHGRERFDRDARLARRGRINPPLLKVLLQDPYLKRKPPKSTGREYFGAAYVKKLLVPGR